MIPVNNIRNLAIIAHVDHGKTTIIDSILKQSNTFRDNENVSERLMDSNELEKERGITILAKCTSVFYNDPDSHEVYKMNIIDTPGHADFGGEVERVLSMVEGVVLLVDSAEGVMPQTKFVLNKALMLDLRPIVVINKVDRQDARADAVIDEVFELFAALGATEEQLDFPVLYAVGRDGWAVKKMDDPHTDLKPLFDLIINHIHHPGVDIEKPFSMLATILTADSYVGKILIGKVYSGIAKVNDPIKVINLKGNQIESTKLTKLFGFKGIERVVVDEVNAGDIVAIAGVEKASVSDTICNPAITEPIKSTPVDPPTMSVNISVNSSPLSGRDGNKVTARIILDRLQKEAATNVAINVTAQSSETFEIGGRGELQLGVLIETMRREGFELSVSRPKVLFKKDEATGATLEPMEEVVIYVDSEYSGHVIENMANRKGEMKEMLPMEGDKLKIIFLIPSRGLIGYQSEFRNYTRGTGVMSRIFHSYAPYKGDIGKNRNGVIISGFDGETTAYALNGLEDRGILFVGPKTTVYKGMIIGEHNKSNDIVVNPVRSKELTNMRAASADKAITLSPHKEFTLEETISYITDDELVEVTPKNIRLRKKNLNVK